MDWGRGRAAGPSPSPHHHKHMRIIGGSLGGRRLASVKGRMRPTGAKVREALFAILGDRVIEARVLDLFAGTGALGIEALSRGAREAVFVEDDPASLKVLGRNLEDLGLGNRARVAPLEARRALKKLKAQGEGFNLVFLDPPYGKGLAAAALAALNEAGLLAPGGLIAAEHSSKESLPEKVGNLTRIDLRRYGDTQVALYEAVGNP